MAGSNAGLTRPFSRGFSQYVLLLTRVRLNQVLSIRLTKWEDICSSELFKCVSLQH
ncbi:MAG: hypothetical protein LZF60_20042 [Nitrospira sp.]|nr:MAG: hypothetical protein LZF60_20042 [Nitrospira sp.]